MHFYIHILTFLSTLLEKNLDIFQRKFIQIYIFTVTINGNYAVANSVNNGFGQKEYTAAKPFLSKNGRYFPSTAMKKINRIISNLEYTRLTII